MPALHGVTDWRKLMSGDDISRLVTIYDGAAPYNFSTASLVECAITDGWQRQYIGKTAQSSSATGAAWASGVLAVEFATAASATLIRGTVALEIQITIGGKKISPPLIPLEVEVGVIP